VAAAGLHLILDRPNYVAAAGLHRQFDAMHPELRYLAALHGLAKLDADTMKSAVDALMNQGFYSEECLAALDSSPARLDEVLPAFHAALTHYGVLVPEPELAVWHVIAHHMQRITAQDEDPWLVLRSLFSDIYWDCDFQSQTQENLGDSHGIERLIGIYWALDDEAEHSGVSIDAFTPGQQSLHTIRQVAKDWVDTHGDRC
jgi:hypothetical protein